MDKKTMKKLHKIRKIQLEEPKQKKPLYITKYITKLLIVVILTLTTMITLKSNMVWKTKFYKEVFTKNFSFAKVNQLYQSYFGSPIPFQEFIKKPVATVFNESLTYQEDSMYQDGVKLTVDKNYLVPNQESGMVVFVGEKKGYGKTVIIQTMSGIDIWYGHLSDVNVKLYDYVKEGDLVGEALGNTLYMVFQKEGKNLNYKDYIKG